MPEADLTEPSGPLAAARRRRFPRPGHLVCGALVLALVPVLAEAIQIFVGANFHAVLPGRVYRCAQPSPRAIEQMVASHGIRTVVNLRGCCNPFPWYLDEARATARLDVCQEDVCFSAGRLPSANEMRRFIEVLDSCEYPMVMHCRRGADRTGLASAVVLLLQPDVTLHEAVRQLGVRYGHVRIGRTAFLDDFLDLYADWLRAHGKTHAPAVFRDWALHEYGGGACRATLELLDPLPLKVRPGVPSALRVRATNRSPRPWQFRPTLNAGFHLGVHVWDSEDRQLAMVKSGQRDAVVRPGESIEVTLTLPALERPGRYRLMIDLVDEQHCWFFQTGAEPLEEELQVCE
jgi:protein tyrosine phosphatase (PTP) superfamily phosphohydrolase (DUF442 family)